MRSFEVQFTREAIKDFRKLTPKLQKKLREILTGSIMKNPRCGKKLTGELSGFYSFRLTLKDRIVYSIDEHERIVFVHRAKTHYGD